MARDIDAVKIAGHETRGRRSKAEKARGLTETLKGFEATSKGLMRSLDFALPLGLFAFTSWSSRMRIEATLGAVTVGLFSPDRLLSVSARPTYKGRDVMQLDFNYPDLFMAQGLGSLGLLMSMPGSDLIGLVENGFVLVIYHTLLNGGEYNLPGNAAGSYTPMITALGGPISTAYNFLGWIASFLVPSLQGTTSNRTRLLGFFPSLQWRLADFQANLQKEIDSGRLALPPSTVGVPTPVPLDSLVRRMQLDAGIRALAHGAFLTLLLKRGGGVVPTE